MAKRRYQGFGKVYYTPQMYVHRGRRRKGGYFVKFYEPGAVVTYRLVKVTEHKR